MIATRFVKHPNGRVQHLFNEHCCGIILSVEPEESEYATCTNCLRVRRIMYIYGPEGVMTCWGMYYDPYLADSLAGQFMAASGCDMTVAMHPSERVSDG